MGCDWGQIEPCAGILDVLDLGVEVVDHGCRCICCDDWDAEVAVGVIRGEVFLNFFEDDTGAGGIVQDLGVIGEWRT